MLSIEDIRSNYPAPLKRVLFTQHMIKEYLLTIVLDRISKEIVPGNLTFIGGTSLRFCHGLDRFSEDLDFKYIQNELKHRGFNISSLEMLKGLILHKEAETDIKDQAAHIAVIALAASIYQPIELYLTGLISGNNLVLLTSLVFVTFTADVIVKASIAQWNPEQNSDQDNSLSKAGRFIGILERLFVFVFVVSGQWQAIGFLIAAKSVFRFGNLKESKDRKLTEYILIGTLLSFGIAILTAIIYLKLIRNLEGP